MSAKHRIFLDFDPQKISKESTLALDTDTQHRLLKVLRLKEGTLVEVFNGHGALMRGALALKTASLKITETEVCEALKPEIIVYQAVVKMPKLEEVVQRGTELGVSKFVLFDATHSSVSFKGKEANKIERLQRIAQDAARQSWRAFVPHVSGPLSFAELLKDLKSLNNTIYYGDLATKQYFSTALGESAKSLENNINILVGPEGDFSPQEKSALKTLGAKPVIWGPHIMRTETASLAAVAIVQAHLGRA